MECYGEKKKNPAGMDRQREQTGTETGTDPEKEGGIGVEGPGDRNRESRPRGRGENKQEKWEVKGQGQIGGEGTRQARGQSGVEGSPRPAPLPGRAVVAMRTEAAGALPVARPDAHIGGLVGATRDMVFPAPARVVSAKASTSSASAGTLPLATEPR